MEHEPPATFNPPEFNDDAANIDEATMSNATLVPQPPESQEIGAPEPVDATAVPAEAQSELNTDASAQDGAVPKSADGQGYLDTSGAHEPAEKPVFGPQEEMLTPPLDNKQSAGEPVPAPQEEMFMPPSANNLPAEESNSPAGGAKEEVPLSTFVPSLNNKQPAEELSSPTGGIKEEAPDERRELPDEKGEDSGEDVEKESSGEMYERFVEDSIMDLVDHSPEGTQIDEESFVRQNLSGIKVGVQEGLRMVQSGEIDFNPNEYNGNPFDANILVIGHVLNTALRIGVAQQYANEHPEIIERVTEWVPGSPHPEKTNEERFSDFLHHVANEKKNNGRGSNVNALVTYGLSVIAKGAEGAARKCFEKRQEKQAEARRLIQEASEIIESW